MISQKPLFSVVVATYNRASLLDNCLESLAVQDLNDADYEVLIIDNNSTDETGQVGRDYCHRNLNFRLLTENSQGLSFCRNRGWQEARGIFVAYIDDDALASANWLREAERFINNHPEVEAFGGPYEAFSLIKIPAWFPPSYGRLDHGSKDRILSLEREWISGTNMFFRCRLLEKLKGFNNQLGMKKDQLGYGEETNLLIKLKEMDIPVYYVQAVRVKHLIAPYKLSLLWLLKSEFNAGRSSIRTFPHTISWTRQLSSLAKSAAKILPRFFGQIRLPLKRNLYYCLKDPMVEAGATSEKLKIKTR